MGVLYKFTNAKLTLYDGTFVKQGVFYGWGATGDETDYADDKGLSSTILVSTKISSNLDGYAQLFCPRFSDSIPSDYYQGAKPYDVADITNPIIYNELAGHDTAYKFYPDADDESFFFGIIISQSGNSGSLVVTLNRPGTLSDYTIASTTYATSFYRGNAQIGGLFLPWISHNSNNRICGSVAFFHETIEYPYAITGDTPKPSYTRIDVVYNTNVDEEMWKLFARGFTPEIPDTDNPYYDGGTSEEGGGNGNFSEDSDNPETDELPGIDAIGTGFATIFKPSKSQLRNLSELFWNSNVFTFLQNLVENITDMFTSLSMVPFEVEAGSTVSVTWLGIDTAVSLTLAAKQYYEFNMGSIDLSSDSRIFTSGSALDYSPFSRLGIYLPFIGYQELDIDECRGAVINLRYRIDILSGACVAIIKVAGRDIYQFTGNCLTQIPITNENMQSLVTDAVNVGIAAAGKQAAKGTMAATEEQIGKSTMSAERKEVAMAHATESLGHSQSRLLSATANLMSSGKPSFNKTGAVSSAASMMSVKQPYLFLTTPRQSIPEHYQRYCGFPSNITGKLGDFSGYTVVENIRLNDLVATSPEVAEIYDLLKKGVIV